MTHRVVIGVTGGIAAYKAADLVSPLRSLGCEIRVAMTRAATRFVTPLTFASLTGHSVLSDEFGPEIDPSIPHIAWARWADAVVVAPATADFLSRLANGAADDSLTSLLLALEPEKPVVLAPAMNTVMWENAFVRANLERIAAIGGARFSIVPPIEKRLACGEIGAGGLAAVDEIVARVREILRLGSGTTGTRDVK
jgi:phosphopantothenoylcysteine decarboxylase/phosphopantothenate--cysteine ligase